jgi:3-oxoacyl-[acyl-carrier-protein] synthase-3
MNAEIKHIEYYLPQTIVTNADLRNEFPHWDVDKIEKKSGVQERHIASVEETAFDLSVKACEKLFERYDTEKIDGIIYCTQSPDYIMPSNSFLLQRHFKLSDKAFAFDFNHACTGYIYGLMMANSFIQSGIAKNILFVTADTYSRYINPKDKSTRVLFGDGAAVSVIEVAVNDKGIKDVILATHGNGYDKFMIPAGGMRMPKTDKTAVEVTDHLGNIRSNDDIKMDGFAVWSFINSKVPQQINELLDRNKLKLNDIDLFIFHQASLMTLESLVKKMQIPEEKVYINIHKIGNTVSASIPIAVKDAMDAGKLRKGQKIVLCGFGVGLSYGTLLLNT